MKKENASQKVIQWANQIVYEGESEKIQWKLSNLIKLFLFDEFSKCFTMGGIDKIKPVKMIIDQAYSLWLMCQFDCFNLTFK